MRRLRRADGGAARDHDQPSRGERSRRPGRSSRRTACTSRCGLAACISGWRRQRIGAKAADREEAKLLDEKLRAPLLTMQRTAFDDSGRIVEYGNHAYRASRYYFDTTLVDR